MGRQSGPRYEIKRLNNTGGHKEKSQTNTDNSNGEGPLLLLSVRGDRPCKSQAYPSVTFQWRENVLDGKDRGDAQ